MARAPAPFEGYPEARTLLVSATRTRAFLERTTRELLAGGTEHVILSAHGDAICVCIQLALVLEQKMAVNILKLSTARHIFEAKSYAPSLAILLQKSPTFKGSRTPPAYVLFASPEDPPSFDPQPHVRTAVVFPGGRNFSMAEGPLTHRILSEMAAADLPVDEFAESFRKAFDLASAAAGAQGAAGPGSEEGHSGKPKRPLVMDGQSGVHPELRVLMCRPASGMPSCAAAPDGAVLLGALENKFPHGQAHNTAVVYLVAPREADYPTREEFLAAVRASALNLMTALCDFNGLAQREGPQLRIRRVGLVRIPLFSAEAGGASKAQVAGAIIGGLDRAYCHGPSPRVLFGHDEDVFRTVWSDVMGLAPANVQLPGAGRPADRA